VPINECQLRRRVRISSPDEATNQASDQLRRAIGEHACCLGLTDLLFAWPYVWFIVQAQIWA